MERDASLERIKKSREGIEPLDEAREKLLELFRVYNSESHK
jgi:hypothetical protein